MREIKVAIMSKESMRDYTLQIAKGTIKPNHDSPKIFFPSLRAMSEALNESNQALMEAINKHHPETITELAKLVNKDLGNVSRALKRLETYGLVKMTKLAGRTDKMPELMADKISFEMQLTA